ncbi:hypothetical protein D3C87_1817790 [compost metagenome]
MALEHHRYGRLARTKHSLGAIRPHHVAVNHTLLMHHAEDMALGQRDQHECQQRDDSDGDNQMPVLGEPHSEKIQHAPQAQR